MSRFLARLSALVGGAALVAAPVIAAPAAIAAPDGSNVVISEVYGGGGNSGATLTHDFVELYNPTSEPIVLDGMSLDYYSATGGRGNSLALTGQIESGSHFLVQMARGNGGTAALPEPDLVGGAAMSGTGGVVALVPTGSPLLAAGMDYAGNEAVIDLVGWGSATNRFETAPAPGTTNATSVARIDPAIDTDSNAADFATGEPTPRNSRGGEPPVDPEPIEVTPAPVVFADQCGIEDDTYTVPATEGVFYTLADGSVVPAGTHTGTGSVALTAVAAEGYELAAGTETTWTFEFTDVPCQVGSTGVVISEVYGGGGLEGAPYTHDFIELHNPTDAPISIGRYVVTFYSSTGGQGPSITIPADAMMEPGGYYLMQMADSAPGDGDPLPEPDYVNTIPRFVIHNLHGSVELTNGTEVVDLVGFGRSERYETAPTSSLGVDMSAQRTDPAVDTDNNLADFTVAAPQPQSSSSAEPPADETHVVINEVYGGGGNSGAPFQNDFVELFNPTDSTLVLDGYQVKYYSGSTGNLGNTTTLSGSVDSGDYFLIQMGGGANGQPLPTPDATGGANMSASTGTVELLDPSGAIIDLVGYGTGAGVRAETAPTPGLSNTTSAERTVPGVDTDNNAADFTVGAPTPQNSGGGSEEPPDPEELLISEIQGTGSVTPYEGQVVTTRGVVTAVYDIDGFAGIYLQEPGEPDLTLGASQGIFVFSRTLAAAVDHGEYLEVTGEAGEYFGLTQITGNPTWTVLDEQVEPVVPLELEYPATDAEREALEGMLVMPIGTYTVSNNYDTNRFGTVGLAYGTEPLMQPGELFNPVTQPAEFAAVEADNFARGVVLDDGQSFNYTTGTNHEVPLPYVTVDGDLRVYDQVTFTEPVILDYRYDLWSYQPTYELRDGSSGPLDLGANTRTAAPEPVGGDVTLASFNVLNYFANLGVDEPGCGFWPDRHGAPTTARNCEVRGAYDEANFERQESKIVEAINALDADIVGLEEIENSIFWGGERDYALSVLVTALNEHAGEDRWGYVDSPATLPSDEDVIRVAYIYQVDAVSPVGESSILIDHPAFHNAREPLAQAWRAINPETNEWDGETFVTIVNHFKSKGSGGDDGTGQGEANPDRIRQATALTEWAEQRYPDMPVFLLGDFNSYSAEDPMQVFYAAGYTNLGTEFGTTETYVFGGMVGSLDHILANEEALAMVSGATVWNINAVEALALEYSRYNYNVTNFHAPDAYRSSDHDPMKIGLNITFSEVEEPTIPMLTSYQSCDSFGFNVAGHMPGDQIRIDGIWGGQAQYTTVSATDSGWWSGIKPDWESATAVILRGGAALEETRVSIVKAPECAPVEGTIEATVTLTSGNGKIHPVTLTVRDEAGRQVATASVVPTGTHTFTGLPEGTYTVIAAPTGPMRVDGATVRTVEITRADDSASVSFTARKGGPPAGRGAAIAM
ncbi:MAG: ExeM/NucH family extracellular endonuclease [bacterium]|nr:ExeM/NucH family extracellular endonuclease [bacterium]